MKKLMIIENNDKEEFTKEINDFYKHHNLSDILTVEYKIIDSKYYCFILLDKYLTDEAYKFVDLCFFPKGTPKDLTERDIEDIAEKELIKRHNIKQIPKKNDDGKLFIWTN